MLSVANLMIPRLEVDSVEDLADFVSAGAGRADYSRNFPVDLFWASYEILQAAMYCVSNELF